MLELVRQGAPRVQAYEVVQRLAMAAWQGRAPFRDLVEKDPFLTRHLSASAISTCFNSKAYTRHIPEIFKRVFGTSGKARATRKRGSA
jgi:adenylosuccinate lyase